MKWFINFLKKIFPTLWEVFLESEIQKRIKNPQVVEIIKTTILNLLHQDSMTGEEKKAVVLEAIKDYIDTLSGSDINFAIEAILQIYKSKTL